MKYPLSKDGVFLTIQGEGVMIGLPVVFIRLAGCSVGCELCDTDYRIASRKTADEITELVKSEAKKTYSKNVWITGGEPFDHDMEPLVSSLKDAGFGISIATSGHIEIPDRIKHWHGCRICVSPHDPEKWIVKQGDELNIVPMLSGHPLSAFVGDKSNGFRNKRVTPCDGKPETLRECVDFVNANRGWWLGVQAHKKWGLA